MPVRGWTRTTTGFVQCRLANDITQIQRSMPPAAEQITKAILKVPLDMIKAQ
ncbi:MAG: ABC transporter ATP-binding protein [Rhodothermaceae bacterium]|nr:ABC transporter ATP-binding protein [Rhodothermaceae bacterium]MYJ06511.1 ABC transporter ATP-binding protein [Rhodothermaceae bacterium]